MKRTAAYFAFGMSSLLLVGCDAGSSSLPHPTPIHRSKDLLKYSITDDRSYPPFKRQIEIRLERRVHESDLQAIAEHIVNETVRNDFENIFIGYLLPHMPDESMYWATTHFTPELQVRIFGVSVEDENALRKSSHTADRHVIGFWLNDFLRCGHCLFRKNNRVYLEFNTTDGSNVFEMTESGTGDWIKLRQVGKQTTDHWIVRNSGSLEVFDEDGFVTRCQPIEFYPQHFTRPRRPEPFRQWTASSGKFTATAKLVDVTEDDVALRNEEGQLARVRLVDLSRVDRAYAKSRSRRFAKKSK